MKKISTKKQGFTIIEVVLVLAIAGLIFLMVFVALPALQRSQRDTQRRQDMSRLATALTNWQSNNSGSLPGSGDKSSLLTNYLKQAEGEFKDPGGSNYDISFVSLSNGNTQSAGDRPTITFATNAYCTGETATYKSGSSNYAILYKLEGAGSVCLDNQ